MTVKEIDFKLVRAKIESKVFKFTNSDGTVYDMTDSTAVCHLYLTGTPTDIPCTIDVGTGKVTVPFTATHSAGLGVFEYILEEIKISTEVIPLVQGNIQVIEYVPFSESIEAFLRSELPANILLTEDYRNQRILYWRYILQDAFLIADVDLNIESAWPTLVNALLAKLVVYDALMLSARGSFMAFLGGDYTTTDTIGGTISKIETGPTNVEYFDTAKGLESMLKPNSSGQTGLETLTDDICGLANHLRVKVSMCKGNKIPISPKYFQNANWAYPTLDDMDNFIQGQPSQG